MTETKKNKRYTLRIATRIFEKIQSEAQKNKRSIAKEIEFRLEKSLAKAN